GPLRRTLARPAMSLVAAPVVASWTIAIAAIAAITIAVMVIATIAAIVGLDVIPAAAGIIGLTDTAPESIWSTIDVAAGQGDGQGQASEGEQGFAHRVCLPVWRGENRFHGPSPCLAKRLISAHTEISSKT